MKFSQEILPRLVEKTSQQYVLLALTNCFSTIASFDLQMFNGTYEFFALIIYFLSSDQQPKHVIISLFEATKTTTQALVRSLTKLLNKYGLRKKIITYVKNEGSNLNAMTITLKAIVNCESLGLEENFQSTLGMFFQKHVNMALQMKRCVRI